jgi:hypothetical protein
VQEHRDALPLLNPWVRGTLAGLAAGLVLVFGIAIWLDPYDEEGQPRRMETHRQMGLPPCTFFLLTRLPCPSCGMTTSFALLVRGDLVNSVRANSVGTLLALVCLAFIPWALYGAIRGRTVFIRSLERALTLCVVGFLILMMLRWGIVLGMMWYWHGWPAVVKPLVAPPEESWRKDDGSTRTPMALDRPVPGRVAGDGWLQSGDGPVLSLAGPGCGDCPGVQSGPEGARQGSQGRVAGLLQPGDPARVFAHRP